MGFSPFTNKQSTFLTEVLLTGGVQRHFGPVSWINPRWIKNCRFWAPSLVSVDLIIIFSSFSVFSQSIERRVCQGFIEGFIHSGFGDQGFSVYAQENNFCSILIQTKHHELTFLKSSLFLFSNIWIVNSCSSKPENAKIYAKRSTQKTGQ